MASIEKIVISKNSAYISKAYSIEGIFKLRIVSFKPFINEVSYPCIYPFDLWHRRHGHINYRKLKKMASLNLILNCGGKEHSKYQACRPAKYSKNPCKDERQLELLYCPF